MREKIKIKKIMLKKLLTFLMLILTIFTNSWNFVFWNKLWEHRATIKVKIIPLTWDILQNLVNAWLEKISKELWVSLNEVVKAAKDVIWEYKTDLVKLKDKLSIDKFLWKIRGKIKVLKFLKNKWTAKLEKYIFEWDFNKDWIISWVDYKSAIKSWKVEIVWEKRNLWNWFYTAKIRGFNQGLYNKAKISYENFLKTKKWNPNKTYKWKPESEWGWKTKKDESTFFPDNWSKEKIKKEIGEAYGNMKEVTKIVDWKTKKWQIWYLKDGTPIEFKINTDGSISSAYANFIFK